jgi:Uma2 family endonuclease
MSALPKVYWTPEQYLAWERKQESKSEYWNGEIFAMAGASEKHNLIAANVIALLHPQLRSRGCRTYPGDIRLFISATGLYTYADVVVVCGQPQFTDSEVDTLLNPTLIVEVLSKSTENYDRGKKFQNYRTIGSLTDYLMIAQDSYSIEHYVRRPEGQWLFSEARGLEAVLTLPTLHCTLKLSEVYDQVDLSPSELRDPIQISR